MQPVLRTSGHGAGGQGREGGGGISARRNPRAEGQSQNGFGLSLESQGETGGLQSAGAPARSPGCCTQGKAGVGHRRAGPQETQPPTLVHGPRCRFSVRYERESPGETEPPAARGGVLGQSLLCVLEGEPSPRPREPLLPGSWGTHRGGLAWQPVVMGTSWARNGRAGREGCHPVTG